MNHLPLIITIASCVVLGGGWFILALCSAAKKPMPHERLCIYCGQDGAEITVRTLSGSINRFHQACCPEHRRADQSFNQFVAKQ